MDYWESATLAGLWWSCLRPMYALCQLAISASALLLAAASFERFLSTTTTTMPTNKKGVAAQRRTPRFTTAFRLRLTGLALLFALAAKGTMFFELEVVSLAYNDNLAYYSEKKCHEMSRFFCVDAKKNSVDYFQHHRRAKSSYFVVFAEKQRIFRGEIIRHVRVVTVINYGALCNQLQYCFL